MIFLEMRGKMRKRIRLFEEGRRFVHKLKITSNSEWKKYCKSGKLPDDIPHVPEHVYKNQGWISLGDWLGTGTIAPQLKEYWPHDKARKFVHNLGLKSRKEWTKFSKLKDKPGNIPADPAGVYKTKGWKSWGDWLGTGNIHGKYRKYLDFIEAKKIIHSFKINGFSDWWVFCKSNKKFIEENNIPGSPQKIYKKEWISWGDWLGTGNIGPKDYEWIPWKEARRFVRKLKLKSKKEWYEFCKSGKLKRNIPQSADRTYKKEWKGWGDFLGTGRIANQDIEWMPLEEAKIEARKIKLELFGKRRITREEWIQAYREGKIPANLPRYPSRIYGKKRNKK